MGQGFADAVGAMVVRRAALLSLTVLAFGVAISAVTVSAMSVGLR